MFFGSAEHSVSMDSCKYNLPIVEPGNIYQIYQKQAPIQFKGNSWDDPIMAFGGMTPLRLYGDTDTRGKLSCYKSLFIDVQLYN